MKKYKEISLATEIIIELKKKLNLYRITTIISGTTAIILFILLLAFRR